MSQVSDERLLAAADPAAIGWRAIVQSLTRPYPVTVPMVALVMLVPLYLVIANVARDGTPHSPATPLDAAFPLQPAWSLVYGSLYAFLIVLPVLIVRQPDHIRNTVFAYLTVWIVAYICFIIYPTAAPRPASVPTDGFAAWGLRILYDADPPYNCFPSIHVAHSFVSALTCRRVHRGVGNVALCCAVLVALSTLYTKQHYAADVIAGALLAAGACAVFLKNCSRANVPEADRRLAPALAVMIAAVVTVGLAGFWVMHMAKGAA